MGDTLANGKVGIFTYTLRNSDQEEIDSSGEEGPVAYLHGADNLVSGLESAMLGKGAGDKVQVVVSPEEGYGVTTNSEPVMVKRDVFPEDAELFPGLMLGAEDENGQPMAVWVTHVEPDLIYVSTDHPLAGMELHYDVEVVEVRDATQEELVHGHPHGLDGTHAH
jgi:FKBP-type peptidyl-prolyl cis-trans isomerase SlyD